MKKIISMISIIAIILSSGLAMAGTCDVTVTWPNGKPHKGVKLGGSVIHGGMVDNVRTNKHGQATLRWSSSKSLKHVYVNGREKSGCKNGGRVSFEVD